MTHKISSLTVLVIYKPNQPEAASLAQDISCWLGQQGCVPTIMQAGYGKVAYEDFGAQLVVVLGGDGSMLEVARHFVRQPVPLIGVNFGKVGFLADVYAPRWKEGLTAFLEGKTCLLKRMALQWRLLRRGTCIEKGVAVNDVVLARGGLSRVTTLDVSVDDQDICQVRADGLIISSPMGASGYTVSAGGPLVYPDIDALTVTPICPFLCNFPPIVLPYPMTVRAVLLSDSTETHLTIDGQVGHPLLTGDLVEVQGVPQGIHFARLRSEGYFMRLKARGFIEEHAAAVPIGPPKQ